jgi:predicted protein tyrosine phosphatase
VLAKKMDSEGIVRKLQEIVPTYKPNRRTKKVPGTKFVIKVKKVPGSKI